VGSPSEIRVRAQPVLAEYRTPRRLGSGLGHTAGRRLARAPPDFRVLVKPLTLVFGRVVPPVVVAGRHCRSLPS
ncbi:MAG TPA: hypothetical protein VFJ50_01435, partial [Gemmatimonadales bacterium]|nr:hypothetical protein [Gemmatimonadales bacterium]